jgi:Tfp pilus assembly protein PilX
MKIQNSNRGFALVTGLLMLLVLTLLATVVMRGTTLELAMTSAVTRQEQSLSLADSARSLSRELLIAAVALNTASPGEIRSGAVGGRPGNVPAFVAGTTCTATSPGGVINNQLGAAARFGRIVGPQDQRGINALDANSVSLRIQTINAKPEHISALNQARTACDAGTMGMAVIDLSKKIAEGSDVTNPEIIKTVALVGIGEASGGGYSKVVTISDIQINTN